MEQFKVSIFQKLIMSWEFETKVEFVPSLLKKVEILTWSGLSNPIVVYLSDCVRFEIDVLVSLIFEVLQLTARITCDKGPESPATLLSYEVCRYMLLFEHRLWCQLDEWRPMNTRLGLGKEKKIKN